MSYLYLIRAVGVVEEIVCIEPGCGRKFRRYGDSERCCDCMERIRQARNRANQRLPYYLKSDRHWQGHSRAKR